MSELLSHPADERLQAYIEETLDDAARSAVRSHLAECVRCRSEVEELGSLFQMLSGLTAFAPAAGFTERVMSKVRVRRPWAARVNEWLERLAPRSTRGWAVAAAFFALPLLGAGSIAWWIMSRPGVTVQGLWMLLNGLAGQGLASGWQWTWSRLADSNLAGWVLQGLDLAGAAGHGALGLAALMFATATAASIWILYQNLFRTESRGNEYASYVF